MVDDCNARINYHPNCAAVVQEHCATAQLRNKELGNIFSVIAHPLHLLSAGVRHQEAGQSGSLLLEGHAVLHLMINTSTLSLSPKTPEGERGKLPIAHYLQAHAGDPKHATLHSSFGSYAMLVCRGARSAMLQCEGPLCYDFSRLERYINQPHVREELGVGDRSWTACDMDVYADMQGQATPASQP